MVVIPVFRNNLALGGDFVPFVRVFIYNIKKKTKHIS